MKMAELIPGKLYKIKNPRRQEFAEFSRIGGTGMAIFHPPGEPDMQSSFAIDPEEWVEREATSEERAIHG
jgi:hypothetical protein